MTKTFDIEKAQGQDASDLEQTENQPMLKLLQATHPEIKVSHEKHEEMKIEGAVEGDIVFGKDGSILGKPIDCVFIGQSAKIKTEWKPKGKGGVVAHHTAAVTNHPDYKRVRNEKDTKWEEFLGDNELVDTIYGYVLFQREVDGKVVEEKGIIAFTSTNLTPITNFNKQLARNTALVYQGKKGPIKPKLFCHKIKLSSETKQGDGNTWMIWKIQHDGLLDLEADSARLVAGQKASDTLEQPQITAADTYQLTDKEVPF